MRPFLVISSFLGGALGTGSYYRSRFHWEYFPTASSDYKEIVYGFSQGGPNWEELVTILGLIPSYSPPDEVDKQTRTEFYTMIRTRMFALESVWNDKKLRGDLLTNVWLSQRFADIILANLLGREEELEKSIPPGIDGSFNEPAWEPFLRQTYDLVIRIYNGVGLETILSRKIHTKKQLYGLAKLLRSPDERERTAVVRLFTVISRRSAPEPDSVRSEFVTKVIDDIIYTGFNAIKEQNDSEKDLRPFSALCTIMKDSMGFFVGTYLLEKFQITFEKNVLPLAALRNVYRPDRSFADLVEWGFMLIKERGSLQLWENLSGKLLSNTFRHPIGNNDQDNLRQIGLLMDLYQAGLVAPNQHSTLISKIMDHARFVCGHKSQGAFLTYISQPEFLLIYRSGSKIYGSSRWRFTVAKVLLIRLYNWLIDGTQSKMVLDALKKSVSLWMTTFVARALRKSDKKYAQLERQVQSRLSDDPPAPAQSQESYQVSSDELVRGVEDLQMEDGDSKKRKRLSLYELAEIIEQQSSQI